MPNGTSHGRIEVTLTKDGVASDGPVIPAKTLDSLTLRTEKGGTGREGSGLGLAIVAAIADRIAAQLTLRSPRTGRSSGFEATLTLSATPNAVSSRLKASKRGEWHPTHLRVNSRGMTGGCRRSLIGDRNAPNAGSRSAA